MARLWNYLVHCRYHWFSAVTRHDVRCDGNRGHHGAHHGHDDYSRHH